MTPNASFLLVFVINAVVIISATTKLANKDRGGDYQHYNGDMENLDGGFRATLNAKSSLRNVKAVLGLNHTDHRSSCLYRRYKEPHRGSGLPFLADVFAADEGRSVYFVGVNKGSCKSEWRHIQEFHSTDDAEHRFKCIFQDGSEVISDAVHRKIKNDFAYSNAVMMIRCDIPRHLRHLVSNPSTHALLTVSLQSMNVIEAPNAATGSFERRTFRDIPVCHSEWPSFDGTVPPTSKRKKYVSSLMTRVASTYVDNRYGGKQEISMDSIISWIEYHREIGIEHFYIYDSDQEEHGPLERWLMPYIESGVVTYVHFPLEDCVRDYSIPGTTRRSRQRGSRLYTGQIVATNSALRRYAHQSTWIGHWDVDEYLILPRGAESVLDLIEIRGGSENDGIAFPARCFAVCDGDYVDPSMLPFERANCVNKKCSLEKALYRTDRILYFVVHSATATVNNTEPRFDHKWIVNDEEGYFAHYRTDPYLAYDRPGFEGFAESAFTYRQETISRSLKAKVKMSVERYKIDMEHRACLEGNAKSRHALKRIRAKMIRDGRN